MIFTLLIIVVFISFSVAFFDKKRWISQLLMILIMGFLLVTHIGELYYLCDWKDTNNSRGVLGVGLYMYFSLYVVGGLLINIIIGFILNRFKINWIDIFLAIVLIVLTFYINYLYGTASGEFGCSEIEPFASLFGLSRE